jgi:PPP family 3-phenylpropionic acid transporter
MAPPSRSVQWLGAYYFLYFASVGVTLPFLPAYFVSLGMSATQVGLLLALGPLVGLVGPPWFGRWADRTGLRDRVLLWVTAGTLIAWAPLAAVKGFAGCAAVMAVYALFSTAIVPLVDTLTLDHVSRSGGSYAHVRLYGSLGFVVASATFGLGVTQVGRMIVLVPLALIALDLGVGLKLCGASGARTGLARGRSTPAARARWSPDRELVLIVAGTCLHWIASAPYNGTFVLYVRSLGLSNGVVGVSVALGVCAEVWVMALYPRLATVARPRTLLAFACFASALRWVGMAWVHHAVPLVALTLLHGLTFGLFYVAAVDAFARRVPSEHRAQGQAFFVAVTFGLGGLAGYVAAGAGYDVLGGARLFVVAACVELVACAVVLTAKPARLALA